MDGPSKRSSSSSSRMCGYSLFFLYNVAIAGLLVYTQVRLHFGEERFKEYADSQTARVEHLERKLYHYETRIFQMLPKTRPSHDLQKSSVINEADQKKSSFTTDFIPSDEESNSTLQNNSIGIDKREVLSDGKTDLASLLQLKQGPAGPPGPPGPRGPDGPPGRDGRDAVNTDAVTHLVTFTVQKLLAEEKDKLKPKSGWNGAVSGTSYFRWGRTVCPNDSSLIYQGRAATQYYSENGGSSQYLCLPENPEYSTQADRNSVTKIYGVEYYQTGHLKRVSGQSNNVPCALCQTNGRTTKIVFPAKLNCPDDYWKKEYSGYLMTEGVGNGHDGRTEYLCVDADAESIPGMVRSEYGGLLYFVGATCKSGSRSGNLGRCPPYEDSTPLTCTVCSK